MDPHAAHEHDQEPEPCTTEDRLARPTRRIADMDSPGPAAADSEPAAALRIQRAQSRTRSLRLRGRVARTARRRPSDEPLREDPPLLPNLPVGLPPRLLLIDEDHDLLHLARGILGGDGYLVDTAGDAVDGLGRALRFPPAAILLNIYLGGQDGLVVFGTLRRHERTALVPVVALAPLARKDHEVPAPEELRTLGFAGYVSRPVDWQALRRQFRVLVAQPVH